MRGRASVAIELSDEERSFLEAQLRKHKAERSLSDRCRIVLRCADALTRKQIQRGVHRSVAELEADIMAFIDAHNDDPKPYTWVKSADEILASVKRFCLKSMNRTSIPGD